MSTHTAYTCNRCRKVALDELPKGWIAGRDNSLKDGSAHTCPECQAALNELAPFLDWVTSRLARKVHAATGSLSSVFGDMYCRDCSDHLGAWWDSYMRNEEP